MKKINGFSIIELAVVLAVIGLLAALAVPFYQKSILRGQVDRCAKLILPARMTADSLIQLSGSNDASSFNNNPGALGLAAGANCDAVNVTSGDDGVVTIVGTVNNGAGVAINQLTLSRSEGGGWSCSSSSPDFSLEICP